MACAPWAKTGGAVWVAEGGATDAARDDGDNGDIATWRCQHIVISNGRAGGALLSGFFAMLACSGLAAEDMTHSLSAFHVQDQDFKPVEVPTWVYESPCIAFVTDDMLEKAAQAGVQVVHSGAGTAYYPLVRDDAGSGLTPDEKTALERRVNPTVNKEPLDKSDG